MKYLSIIGSLLALTTCGASAQEIRFPSAFPRGYNQPPPVIQYPQPYVAVVPQAPRNNLEAEINTRYQLEATRNLQIRNNALEAQAMQQLYKLPESDSSGGYEIIGK